MSAEATVLTLPARPTGLRRLGMIAAGMSGSAVYEFTWSIAGVGLPHMQGTFSATPDQIAWVMTAFIMGTVVTIASTGWLAARFGRRRVFLASLIGFSISLVMCGLATSLAAEVGWRFAQGVFGAALLPLGQAITIDAFPRDRQGAATAIWITGTIGGAVLGPFAGGIVVEFLSWPWMFYLNLPIAGFALLTTWSSVPESERDPGKKLDWFGLLAIVVAATALQILFSRGERLDWFASTEIAIEAGVAAIALYIFVAHSLTTENPFFRPALFRDRNFCLGLISALANGAVATLPLVVLPLMLQELAGFPSIDTGILLLARAVGLSLISVLTALNDRLIPERVLMIVGFGVVFVSGLDMAYWTADVDRDRIILINLAQGFGAGAIFISITNLAISTLPQKLKTEGLALYYTVLFTGATLGIAVVVSVLTRMTQVAHAVVGAHVNPYNQAFRLTPIPEAWDIEEREGLAALAAEVSRQADAIAYSDAFLAAALISLAAVPLAFLFKTPPKPGADEPVRDPG